MVHYQPMLTRRREQRQMLAAHHDAGACFFAVFSGKDFGDALSRRVESIRMPCDLHPKNQHDAGSTIQSQSRRKAPPSQPSLRD